MRGRGRSRGRAAAEAEADAEAEANAEAEGDERQMLKQMRGRATKRAQEAPRRSFLAFSCCSHQMEPGAPQKARFKHF